MRPLSGDIHPGPLQPGGGVSLWPGSPPKEAYSAVKPSTLAEERWFRHKLVDVTEFEVVDYAHLESGRSSGESLILGILRFEGGRAITSFLL